MKKLIYQLLDAPMFTKGTTQTMRHLLLALLVLATLHTTYGQLCHGADPESNQQPVRPNITQIVVHPIFDGPSYLEKWASVMLEFYDGTMVLHEYDPAFTEPIIYNREPFSYNDTRPWEAVTCKLYTPKTGIDYYLYPETSPPYNTDVINIHIRFDGPNAVLNVL